MREGWGDTHFVSLSTELRTGDPAPPSGQGHGRPLLLSLETDRHSQAQAPHGATSKQGHPSSAGSASQGFTLKCLGFNAFHFY